MNTLKFFLSLFVLFVSFFSHGGEEREKTYRGLIRFNSCVSEDKSPFYDAYESLSIELIGSFMKELQGVSEIVHQKGLVKVFSRIFIDGEETGLSEISPVRGEYESNMVVQSPYLVFKGYVPSSVKNRFIDSDVGREDIKILNSETVESYLNLAFGYTKVIVVYGEIKKEGLKKIRFTALYPVSIKCVIVSGIALRFEE